LIEPSAPLEALGFDDARLHELEELGSQLEAGRITRVDRGFVVVRTALGDARIQLPLDTDVAVGDFVGTADGVLRHVLERRGAVTRLVGNRHETLQVVAANVDLVLVVRPLDLSSSPQRIQSLVNLAYEAGATPVILLTKADLVDDTSSQIEALVEVAPGVDILRVSVVSGEGLAELEQLIAHRTVVLVGESGGGKSTLTNALVGDEVLATASTRADGQGRHTTSHRELIALPNGGAIIDTPGVREVVAALTAEQIAAGFADVTELATQCRFSDCSHTAEPGCAVVVALREGTLAASRFTAFQAALRDAAWNERREDRRLQAEQRRSYRTIERQRRRDAR
jgi:ribosome biogenesis GTPase